MAGAVTGIDETSRPPWATELRRRPQRCGMLNFLTFASGAATRSAHSRGSHPELIAVIPGLVPLRVVERHVDRGALFDRRDELMSDTRPREETARLVCAHSAESPAESRMPEHLGHGDAEVFPV